jgi:hypothetical protein
LHSWEKYEYPKNQCQYAKMNKKTTLSFVVVGVALTLFGLTILQILFSSNTFYDKTEDNPANLQIFDPSTVNGSEPMIGYFGENLTLKIPEFWSSEYQSIKSGTFNFTRLSSRLETQTPVFSYNITKHQQVNITHVTFNISSWDGTALLIDGDLYEPMNISTSTNHPGFLFMHGLFGEKSKGYERGKMIAAKGSVCLSISLPGHGVSEGPKLYPDLIFNYTNTPEGRKSPLLFLGIRAGLAALQVLENHPNVNGSNLGISGVSWGGIHTQYIAGVEHALNGNNRLKSTVVNAAAGDLLTSALQDSMAIMFCPSFLDPSKMSELGMAFIQDWDPMIYAAQISKINYIVGTNDEFFSFTAMQNTFAAIKAAQPNGTLEISLIPGGHHDQNIPWESLGSILRRDLWQESSWNPQLNMSFHSEYLFWGSQIQVSVQLRIPNDFSIDDINEMTVSYKHYHLGSVWKSISIPIDKSKVHNNSGVQSFTATIKIPRPIMNCKTEFYTSIQLKDGGILSTHPMDTQSKTPSTYLFPILILGLLYSLMYLCWRNFNKKLSEKYLNSIEMVEEKERIILFSRLKLGLLILCETLILYSILMDWVGAGITEKDLYISPLDILSRELYIFMNSGYWLYFVILGFYVVAVLIFLYRPKMAAMLNLLFGVIIAILVPFVKYFVLVLPDQPILNTLEIRYGVGVWLCIIGAIFQWIVEHKWQQILKKIPLNP